MGRSADFSLKVWLTVILVAPVILNLINREFLFDLYFFAIIFGIFYSLPALLIFLAFAYYINRLIIPAIFKKLILATTGFVITYLTFYLLEFRENFTYVYCGTLVTTVFVFKLDKPENPAEDN